MAKATKPKKERAKNYDEKLKVNGSFADLISASVAHTKANIAKKVAAKKDQKKEE
jgi:hypothetical protein